jgi:ATP-binding cassette subfamily F protein uup
MLARLCTHFLALDGKGGATHHADYEQWERAHEHAAREARAAEREARGKQSSAPAPASTEPAAPVASASAPPAPPAPAPKKVKLSYKEQRELDQVEPAILEGEEQVAQLAAQLDAPDVARDPRKLHEASVRLSEAQARVAKLYERWTELEAKQRGE